MNTRRFLTVYFLNKIGYSIILIGRPVPSTRYSIAIPDPKKSVGFFDSRVSGVCFYPRLAFTFSRWLLVGTS